MFEINTVYKYKGFKTIFHFSKDDNIFYGSLENIQDSVSFDGHNLIEVYQMFINAVEDYLDFCKELGKEIEYKESGWIFMGRDIDDLIFDTTEIIVSEK